MCLGRVVFPLLFGELLSKYRGSAELWVYLSLPSEFDVLGGVSFSCVFDWGPLISCCTGGSLFKGVFEPYFLVLSCLFLYLFVECIGVLKLLAVSCRFLIVDELECLVGDPRPFGTGWDLWEGVSGCLLDGVCAGVCLYWGLGVTDF